MKFHGKIEQGKFVSSPETRDMMKKHLKLLEGKEITIEIKRKTNRKTNPQNNLFHANLQIVADHFGYQPEELKLELKRTLGFYEEIITAKRVLNRYQSFADYSTEQAGRMLDLLYQIAAENEIKVWETDYT